MAVMFPTSSTTNITLTTNSVISKAYTLNIIDINLSNSFTYMRWNEKTS